MILIAEDEHNVAGFFLLFFFDVDGKSGSGLDDEDGGLDYVDGEKVIAEEENNETVLLFSFFILDGCAPAIVMVLVWTMLVVMMTTLVVMMLIMVAQLAIVTLVY